MATTRGHGELSPPLPAPQQLLHQHVSLRDRGGPRQLPPVHAGSLGKGRSEGRSSSPPRNPRAAACGATLQGPRTVTPPEPDRAAATLGGERRGCTRAGLRVALGTPLAGAHAHLRSPRRSRASFQLYRTTLWATEELTPCAGQAGRVPRSPLRRDLPLGGNFALPSPASEDSTPALGFEAQESAARAQAMCLTPDTRGESAK